MAAESEVLDAARNLSTAGQRLRAAEQAVAATRAQLATALAAEAKAVEAAQAADRAFHEILATGVDAPRAVAEPSPKAAPPQGGSGTPQGKKK